MPARISPSAYAVTLLLLSGELSACKQRDNFVDVMNDPNRPKDAGVNAGRGAGGQNPSEGGSGEAGSGASGSGANPMDAAVGGEGGSDGSSIDQEDSGPIDRSCEAAAEMSEWSAPVGFSDESGFALTTGLTGFGVAFHAMGCGVIGAAPVKTLGPYKEPNLLLGDCSTVLDLSLLHVSDGYRMVWVDNSAGSAELQTMLLSDMLTAPAEVSRTRMTSNPVRELRPVMSAIGGAAYLSWIAADGDKHQVELQRMDQTSETKTLLAYDQGYRPTRLALAQLGRDRGALAFVDEQGKPGIWLLPLDESAQPVGEPVMLSGAVNSANTVDMATREADGGVIVYSIDIDHTQPEVRFRRLSKLGGFLGEEIKVAGSPEKARDASITRLGDGYVVAYRQLSSSDNTRAEIRLAFITKEGTVTRDNVGRMITHFAGTASASGGRITARISIDGQLLLGFVDIDDSGRKLRLIRKRLDCAL